MPKLLKKTHKISIHGHRGSRGTHPENTIPAFEAAVQAGCDYFELDVHLTKDNVVVVFHDFELSRLCADAQGKRFAGPVPIRQLTMAEISTYHCGNFSQPNFPKQKLIPGTKIPTLEDVLEWVTKTSATIGINIEIKLSKEDPLAPNAEDFAKRVLTLIERFNVLPRTLVQSFDFRPLECLKRLRPDLFLSYLFERELDFADIASDRGAGVAAPFFGLITPEAVRFCHSRGIQVLPWTVNEKADWKSMIAMGVDGIITDYPRDLIASGLVTKENHND